MNSFGQKLLKTYWEGYFMIMVIGQTLKHETLNETMFEQSTKHIDKVK